MEITQETVKEWLARYPDRDRNWLAEQCGAEKGTVDNWLSTARGIPARAMLIIENLMRKDAESEPVSVENSMRLPVECTIEQHDLYTRAYRVSECEHFSEWITTRLNAAAEADLAARKQADKGNGTEG